MSRKTRERNEARLKELGIYDDVREDSLAWRVMRDSGRDKLEKEIRDFMSSGKLPDPMPSDLKRRKSEYRPRATKPATKDNGTLLVFWRDETEQITGEQMKHDKQIMKRNNTQAELLTDIFGSKAKGTQGYLKQKYGEIGITASVIAYSKRDIEKYKREYRGWTLIYNGKAILYKDLLIVMNAAISQGVYQPLKKRNQAIKFINQVRQVNPKNGQRLMEDYKKYSGRGYYDEN